MIAIVHRLETILDFDKVALLDAGQLIEFDNPHALLSRPSAFNQLYNGLVAERVDNAPVLHSARTYRSLNASSAS